MTHENEEDDVLKARLNTETGQLSWQELQRHFARGIVLVAEKNIDLIEIAAKIIKDDSQALSSEIDSGGVTRATDTHALDWQDRDPVFWAVVVAPWVLVQEKSKDQEDSV